MSLEKISNSILKTLGWKIEGDPYVQGDHIYALYPHTTIWDTPLFILVGLSKMKDKKFLIAVKESFDKPILKDICKKFNLLPIQRNSSGLKLMINTAKNNNLNIAMAIEGTRKKSTGIKPGFYILAKRLNRQIILVTANWKTKTITIFEPFKIEDTFEATVEKTAEILEPLRPLGKYPENESPIVPYE
jgi:1-acyl-sn-glycerol-3-phosphate acyltransferase